MTKININKIRLKYNLNKVKSRTKIKTINKSVIFYVRYYKTFITTNLTRFLQNM